MRCLFTVFAEDVELLPLRSFTELLEQCRGRLDAFPKALRSLWATMDEGGFESAIMKDVRAFNGTLFEDPEALPVSETQLELPIKSRQLSGGLVGGGARDFRDAAGAGARPPRAAQAGRPLHAPRLRGASGRRIYSGRAESASALQLPGQSNVSSLFCGGQSEGSPDSCGYCQRHFGTLKIEALQQQEYMF